MFAVLMDAAVCRYLLQPGSFIEGGEERRVRVPMH
jgi:hypothetical protein